MKHTNQGFEEKATMKGREGNYERSWKLFMKSHDDDRTIVNCHY